MLISTQLSSGAAPDTEQSVRLAKGAVNRGKEEQTNKALTSIDLIVSAIVLTLHADIDTGSGMVSFERWLKRSSLSVFFDQFLLVFRRNQEFRLNLFVSAGTS